MAVRVRPATAADAAACIEIYRPYALDTPITFETDVPTVEEMADRIAAARATREWLVLDVDGTVTGYAYAHQFNRRAACQWSSRRASTSRRVGYAPAADECSTPSC